MTWLSWLENCLTKLVLSLLRGDYELTAMGKGEKGVRLDFSSVPL